MNWIISKLKQYRLCIALGIILLFVIFNSLSQSSTWTVQTLKEYVDQRFNSVTEAVTKAEAAAEKRFESVNEFRSTLADQQRTFIPRAEYEGGHMGLHAEVSELKTRLDKLESSKQGGNTTFYIIIAVVSTLVALFALSRNFIAGISQKNKEVKTNI